MVRNTSDQDDVVQETFIKAWRRLSSFRADASFRTWIISVATNEALQQYRRQRSNPVSPTAADLDTYVSQHESPCEALFRSEAHHTVRAAVAHLPDKYRQVLILRDLDELTTQETARSLKFSIQLVKTRLMRARRMLSRTIRAHKVR
jgi:RNA polymerase sigma-70 factor (ECF subfamily)